MDLFSEKRLQQLTQRVGLDQLSSRERIIVFAGIVFVLLFLLFQFIISPYFSARSNLQDAVARKQQELIKIQQLQKQYGDLQTEKGGIKESLKGRPAGFTLFTFLDQQAEKALIKPQIKYMKPSVVAGDGEFDESLVEMKLQEITLEKLVLYMRLIESPELVVSLRRLSIQQSGTDAGYLDVILQIATFVEAS